MTPVARIATLVAFNLAIFVATVAAYGFLHKIRIASPLPFVAGGAVAFAASFYMIRHGANGRYTGVTAIVGGVCAAMVVYFLSLATMIELWGS